MLLVGLRAANLPSPEETQILTAFIYKKYTGLTIDEIQLAFEKAVSGELEIDTANCYENFSCEYFGKIMAAYKKWASKTFNENQMYNEPQTENLLPMQADWKELVEVNYQQYLTGTYNAMLWPWQMYDECVKVGYIEENAFEDYLDRAMFETGNRLENERNECIKSGQVKEVRALKEQIETLQETDDQIIHMAKKLAVLTLFRTAKEKQYTHLFEKE